MALQIIKQALCATTCPRGTSHGPVCRHTHSDQSMERIGQREIVGYGWNGSPCYQDRLDYPFPSVRFQEPNADICLLREKEAGDWKKLTIEEKKTLYRFSFCQTFAELKAPNANWKFAIGAACMGIALGIFLSLSYHRNIYGELPPTFDEERRRAQLKRIIALEFNPIQGLTSNWDYEKGRWK